MFWPIKTFFSNMLGKNEQVYQKPLNTLSIIFVIVFDIFLFSNILDAYTYQKNLVVSPYEQYQCSNFFTETIEDNSLIDTINFTYSSEIDSRNLSVHCQKIAWFLNELKKDSSFSNVINQKLKIQDTLADLENQKINYETQYSKYLNESSAGISSYEDRLSNIPPWQARINYQEINNKIEKNKKDLNEIIKTFAENNSVYKNIKSYINENSQAFSKEYENAQYWYPVKITFYQMMLLIPLFFISLFLYKFFLRKQNKIFTILFSNLTFITGIFAFVLLAKVLYFIIPQKFLANFIALLKSLSLGFLWNYILVIFWVVIFGAIIYASQKWAEKIEAIKKEQEAQRIIQNKKKVLKERFHKGLCGECGEKLLPESHFCQVCGTSQEFECEQCHTLIPKAFDFCNKCWKKHN